MIIEAQVILGVMSVALASVLVCIFFKVYKFQRSLFLLGLPFGFLSLGVSYLLLDMYLIHLGTPVLSTPLMWLRLMTRTGGFLLIAGVYFFSYRSKKVVKQLWPILVFFSVVSMACACLILITINPILLSAIYSIDVIFTISNLALISYVIHQLIKKSREKGNFSGLLNIIIAFVLIWLGQFSSLIWDINSNMTALLASQFPRILSLVLLIEIYYRSVRNSASPGILEFLQRLPKGISNKSL